MNQSTASPRIVTAGGLRVDYLITRAGTAMNGIIGGNALYSAVGAAVWSDSVGVWTRVGQNYSVQWLESLPALGIANAGIVRVPESQEHRTFYAYTDDGIRHDTDPEIHYSRIGETLPHALKGYVNSTAGQDLLDVDEPLSLRKDDWPDSYRDVQSVHLAPLPIRCHLNLPEFLRSKGVSYISVDPGERYMIPQLMTPIREILTKIDCFLPSIQETRSLLGNDISIEVAARTFVAWGVPMVIIKAGRGGIYLHHEGTDSVEHYPPFHQDQNNQIIDVTGAGDAFCGGFCSGWLTSGRTEESVRCGLVSASLAIEGYGAIYALERKSEAAYRLQQLRTAK